MADILSLVRASLATKNFEETPLYTKLPTAAEMELVYKAFDTCRSLDDPPLFARDVL